jgi:hypothetical protein
MAGPIERGVRRVASVNPSRRRDSPGCAVFGVVMVLAVAVSGCGETTANGSPPDAHLGPYFEANFNVEENSYTFGQTPSWTRTGDVLSQELDESGILQVYRSRLDGAERKCLTCGQLPGPNGFAEERPQGDWIMFCTYGNQPQHLGSPCLGGYGSDLYVMRPDGSRPTRLAADTLPNNGADYSLHGTPYDTLHPYWSPDGTHVSWTRIVAHPLSQGGETWEIMLADFVVSEDGDPEITNARVVGPAFGVYETQQWAPDGSGLLFTAFGPRQSPYQATPPGWMHQELYFMRLYGPGASPDNPLVTQLSDDTPVYQEQAVFTPDMREVIFMTNRNSPNGSWYNQVVAAAMRTGFDAPHPGSVGALQFLADFSDPAFRADLYMLDVSTHALRPLTNFQNVIPEFHWNGDSSALLWSGVVGGADHSYITRVGSFPGITAAQRRTPSEIPAPGLYGNPIEMERVTSPASVRASTTTETAPPALAANPAPYVPRAGSDVQKIPPVVASYFALWLGQLKQLGEAAGANISAPPISISN